MNRRKTRRSSSSDPHEEEGFLPPYDPHEEEGFLPPYDPHEEEGFLPPYDPHEEEGFLPPYDPHEEEGFLPPYDPHEEEGFLPPYDPHEWRLMVAAKKRRRRRFRHRSLGPGALCGDDLGGRPGNVRTSLKKDFSGALVIRLASQYASAKFDDARTLQDLAEKAELSALGQLFEEYGLPPAPRVIVKRGPQEIYADGDDATPNNPRAEEAPADPAQIRDLEQKASDRGLPPLHSLLSYWRVDVNNHTRKQVVKLRKRLNKLREVDYAYRELAASDPSGGQDTFEGSQGYLDKAPWGIDARWAALRGGDGSGVKLVDLEQGWIRNHLDFDPSGSDLLHGANRHLADDDYRGDHGTAVLGELVAVKGLGAIGISPPASGSGVVGGARGVMRLGLASHYDAKTHSNGHVAEAITAAISEPDPYLQEGDVLLIEVQRSFLPTEVDDADFDAIRLATALGIIVIEAAGNGGRNLDAYQDKRGAHVFNRRGGGFRESGAVIVGAALSKLPHNRKRASNYGSRIDCYAWGDRVVTAGYGDLLSSGGQDTTYTADFSNTSAAAPIIASAALILQGMYQQATSGRRLPPGQMRTLLANPATGTRQGRGVRGHIGVMPNLRAIIEHTLRIVPDVYMRDSLGDTGAVPATGRVSASPDVLVSRTERRNPVRAFGQGSGTENDPTLAYKAVAGRDNFIYVRMKNRGLGDAEKVRATVYWTEAATLSTPDRWHEIGASESIQVPQGDTLAVTGPIRWRSVPKSEVYSLVTLIEDTGEPTRLPPGLLAAEGGRARQRRLGQESEAPRFDWFAFLAFLRNHNHLAVRNFHVIDDIPAAGTPKELDFLITGTPAGDRGRFFDLEILQSLPKKAELYFDVPMTLAPAISGSPWRAEVNGRFLRFHLPNLPRVPFCRVPLSAGAEHDCRFVVVGADGMESGGHGFAIRQLYRGQEVGRVSWQFHRASGRLRRRLRSRR